MVPPVQRKGASLCCPFPGDLIRQVLLQLSLLAFAVSMVASIALGFPQDKQDSGIRLRIISTLQTPDPVNVVAMSPDGLRIVTAGRKVRLYDVRTLQLLQNLETADGAIFSLAFSPDGKQFACIGSEGNLMVFDAVSGKLATTLRGHQGAGYALAFSADGTKLVTGGHDRAICVWDRTSDRQLVLPTSHRTPIVSTSISPDGRFVASGDSGGVVTVLDLACKEEIASFSAHSGYVTCLLFSSDGNKLVSGSNDCSIRIWDLSTKQPIRITKSKDAVRSLVYDSTGLLLIAGGGSPQPLSRTPGFIQVWDATTLHPICSSSAHSEWIASAAVSPRGNTLISASHDGSLVLWALHR